MMHALGTIIKVKLSESAASAVSSISIGQPSTPCVQPARQQRPVQMQCQAKHCNQLALTEAYCAASDCTASPLTRRSRHHALSSNSSLVCLLLCPSDVLPAAEDGLLLLQLDLVADMPMNSSNKYFGSQWRR